MPCNRPKSTAPNVANVLDVEKQEGGFLLSIPRRHNGEYAYNDALSRCVYGMYAYTVCIIYCNTQIKRINPKVQVRLGLTLDFGARQFDGKHKSY